MGLVISDRDLLSEVKSLFWIFSSFQMKIHEPFKILLIDNTL